jgi:hypothetical protein
MALVVTGCPHNQYVVQLKPRGNSIERTLVFYREDGVDEATGAPKYQDFDEKELAGITALYPAQGVTNASGCYVARGVFTEALPADVGGAGSYTNLTTSLGEAGFYVERFRGNDDMAGMTARRFQAADRLADLMIGWSQTELGREPGYEKLRQFLEVDFRRDLKNLSAYWWDGRLANGYNTNAGEEFAVRFGQYLFEHGYFTMGEIPGVLRDAAGDDAAMRRRIQRLVARKMGVPEWQPVPDSLAFLADEKTMDESLDKYLAGTELYVARLKQWEADKKLKPDLERPKPRDLAEEAAGNLIDFEMLDTPDHLVVQLALPAAPLHSNGRWDAALKQVVWDTTVEERAKAVHLPVTCYANWARADEAFQTKHFGKLALTRDELTQYCLWRGSQDAQHGGEWDAFLAGLQPEAGLVAALEAFRFSGEPAPAATNGPQKVPVPSDYPREMLKTALR